MSVITVFLILVIALAAFILPACLKVYPDAIPDWLKVVFLAFGSLFKIVIALAGVLIVFGVLVAVLG